VKPPIIFYAFDLLRLNGKDLQNLPIEEGEAKLEGLLKKPAIAPFPYPTFGDSVRLDIPEPGVQNQRNPFVSITGLSPSWTNENQRIAGTGATAATRNSADTSTTGDTTTTTGWNNATGVTAQLFLVHGKRRPSCLA
jgi:hypothetical protein